MNINGIYKIESKIKPERIYIGSAININKRWGDHLRDLKDNKHHSIKLQRHFNKYGAADLSFSVLLCCEKEDLIKIEQYFMDSYNTYFNICKIAGSPLGMKRSDEMKKKMSILKKGNKYFLGKHHSEESKQKNRESNIGKHICSDETRRRLSESHKGKTGRIPWNKGKKDSDEVRQKKSESRITSFATKRLIQLTA